MLCLSVGCQGEAPLETLDDAAERLVADLGEPDGDALANWLDAEVRTLVRRRCPDCPAERRVTETKLTFEEGGDALGRALRRGPGAEERGDVFRLKHGARRCEASCCRWSMGLIEHGSTHLEEACFARDARGTRLVSLDLVDG